MQTESHALMLWCVLLVQGTIQRHLCFNSKWNVRLHH